MNITFLGTGTSGGVPFIGCHCEVCSSADAKNKRLRTSVWLQTEDANIVIDSGPDFRYQMLRAGVDKLDAVVFTHGHKDHTAGLDDVRAYNYWQEKAMDLYATEETQAALKREFAYAFGDKPYPGIPLLNLHTIDAVQPFKVYSITFQPVPVLHYKMEVLGFRIGGFTYVTDANYMSAAAKELCRGSEVLVLNALRHEPHISHFTLSEAIALAKEIGAKETYFTHISHQLGLHEAVEAGLPEGMHLAYDGLRLTLP